MKPAPFDYLAPGSVAELLDRLARYGDEARILAGGQSLMPMLNMRLARPAVLLDINRIAALAGIDTDADRVVIGAATRYRAIETSPEIARRLPLLALAMPYVAHPAVRNRGTLGGSLALADPSAELPACALLLEARLRLASTRGERTVAASDFFRGLMATAAESDEAIIAIEFPVASAGDRFAFREFSRRHGDFAIAGVAARLRCDGRLRVVLFGLADRPVVATAVARLAEETARPSVAALKDAIASEIEPHGDPAHPAALRLHLAGVLAQRALQDLTA